MNNRIVECAVGAGSEYSVTKDKDLLRLDEYGGIKIVRAVDLLKRGMGR
jgi:predicted nucleic acid-binding protein